MPSSKWLALIAMLASPAGADQPWESSEISWLAPKVETRPLREQRLRLPPERFSMLSADGNYVPPRYTAGDESRLMDAVRREDVDVVRALLKKGANPNIGDYWRNAPLLEAVRLDNIELVQMLLDAGAVPNIKGHGHTPLGLASTNGNVRLVELLVRAGADPDRKSDDGDTAVHAAALMGHAAVIRALAPARPDWRVLNREGLSAVAVAAANGQYAAVTALVHAGAPVDWGDKKFHPPLWWAFSVGDLDMARLLIKLGATPGQLPVGSL